MITFYKLWETMQGEPPLRSSGDPPAVHAVRAGLAMRGDGGHTFWDDFIHLCNNSEGLADLLEVGPEKVASWASRVQEVLEKVHESDSGHEEPKKNVIPTGNKF